MIRNPRQIQLMRLGVASLCLANFGGDSSSDSSTRTDNQTQNNTASTDKRNTVADQAIGLSGDNNTIDRSTNSLTQFNDSSNRSTSSITSFLDNSNRSTNFSDSSNRSTTDNSDRSTSFTDNSNRSTNTTVTDYGSVGASIGMAGVMTTQAFDTAQLGIKGAIDSLQVVSNNNLTAVSKAFDMAKSSAANAQTSGAQMLGFATSALADTQQALANAKDGGQSKTVMYALLAVTAIGVAFAFKK
jgi:hypothetical protein